MYQTIRGVTRSHEQIASVARQLLERDGVFGMRQLVNECFGFPPHHNAGGVYNDIIRKILIDRGIPYPAYKKRYMQLVPAIAPDVGKKPQPRFTPYVVTVSPDASDLRGSATR